MNASQRLETINEKANSLKNNIIQSKAEYNSKVVTYYVSNLGDDQNTGTSPDSPWRTIDRVNSQEIIGETNILFMRGDKWRGRIMCKSNTTYSAYGNPDDPKPLIIGSAQNYANSSLWEKTETPYVYRCTKKLSNVGIIAIDHSFNQHSFPESSKIVAIKKLNNCLENDLEFYSDLATNDLYLFSFFGNPGRRFLSIEIGERKHIFTVSDHDNVTIDNMDLRYTGGHAISASGGTKNLTVRNCDISWIGGCVHTSLGDGKSIQYGNAIEIYGPLDGFYVYNNYVHDIYDTAITFQFSVLDASIAMSNVEFHHNLVERCHWSIEWYNTPTPGYDRTVSNVSIYDNILRFGGYGWGSRYRRRRAALGQSCKLPETTDNFVFNNNICDRCTGVLISVHAGGDRFIEFKNNTFIQVKGRDLYETINNEIVPTDENSLDALIDNCQINPELIIIDSDM